jgi:hypothetical protein
VNCQPGDLAVVIADGPYLGWLVEVLRAAPAHRFQLPDGHWHRACEPGDWVLKLLGSKAHAKVADVEGGPVTRTRLTEFGVGADRHLRPLRGELMPESHDEEIAA